MAQTESKVVFDANAKNKEMNRNSRQILSIGVDTMKNLSELKVLIIGQKGMGVETAKDLILQGPNAVTVYDNGITEWTDLGTNFFLRESDVGNNPRSVGVKYLKELNPNVDVNAYSGELDEKFLSLFGAVVVTVLLPLKEIARINEICRSHGISFIFTVTTGVVSSFFADFGRFSKTDNKFLHVVKDLNGEPSQAHVIENFTGDLLTVRNSRFEIPLSSDVSYSYCNALIIFFLRSPLCAFAVQTTAEHEYDDTEILFKDVKGKLQILNGKPGIKVDLTAFRWRSASFCFSFRVR